MLLIRHLILVSGCLIVLACGRTTSGMGVTYYIDASAGSGSNTGTPSPWQTFARLNTAVYQDSTTILLKRGKVSR